MESRLDPQLRELCERAANEQDGNRLIELAAEIPRHFEARHSSKYKPDGPQPLCKSLEG
jgi:hypothetical protein